VLLVTLLSDGLIDAVLDTKPGTGKPIARTRRRSARAVTRRPPPPPPARTPVPMASLLSPQLQARM
jgi:hypothetical protein